MPHHVLQHACTHDADTPQALGPLGEARLGGEEDPEGHQCVVVRLVHTGRGS